MPMLTALADLAHRRPRAVAGTALVVAIAAAWFGSSTPSRLESSDNDFQDSSAESFRTLDLLSRSTGVLPGPSLLIVARLADPAPVSLAEMRQSLANVQKALAVVEQELTGCGYEPIELITAQRALQSDREHLQAIGVFRESRRRRACAGYHQ